MKCPLPVPEWDEDISHMTHVKLQCSSPVLVLPLGAQSHRPVIQNATRKQSITRQAIAASLFIHFG
jgi:hypothetical protein